MLFPTHAVIGLTISLILGFGYIPLLIGSVIPDLVDKPLGMMDVTSRYQTVLHSGATVLIFLIIELLGIVEDGTNSTYSKKEMRFMLKVFIKKMDLRT